MTVARHIGPVLERLLYLVKLRSAALAAYELGGGGRVRASEVAAHVAGETGFVDSPWFRRDVAEALRSAKWRSVNCSGVRMWVGVRRR